MSKKDHQTNGPVVEKVRDPIPDIVLESFTQDHQEEKDNKKDIQETAADTREADKKEDEDQTSTTCSSERKSILDKFDDIDFEL